MQERETLLGMAGGARRIGEGRIVACAEITGDMRILQQ